MEREQITTQLRLPKGMDDRLNSICQSDGVSKNAAILMLIRLGLKFYDADITINLQ